MAQVYEDPKRRYCDPPRPEWTRKDFIPEARHAINCLEYCHIMLEVVCNNISQRNNDVDLKDLLELMRWYGRHNFNKLLEVGSCRNALTNELADADNSLIEDHGASENETQYANTNSIEFSSSNGAGLSGEHIKLHSDLSSSLYKLDDALDVALESQGLDTDAPSSTKISTFPLWNLFVRYYLRQKSWTQLGEAVQHLQSLLANAFPSESYGMPRVMSLKLFQPSSGPPALFVGTTAEKWLSRSWLARWYVEKRAKNFDPDELEAYRVNSEEYRMLLAGAKGNLETSDRNAIKEAQKEVMLRRRNARKCDDVKSWEIALGFPDMQRPEACNRCRALLCHNFLPGAANLANLRTLEELMDDDGFMKQYPPCTCAEYGSDASYQRFRTLERDPLA